MEAEREAARALARDTGIRWKAIGSAFTIARVCMEGEGPKAGRMPGVRWKPVLGQVLNGCRDPGVRWKLSLGAPEACPGTVGSRPGRWRKRARVSLEGPRVPLEGYPGAAGRNSGVGWKEARVPMAAPFSKHLKSKTIFTRIGVP